MLWTSSCMDLNTASKPVHPIRIGGIGLGSAGTHGTKAGSEDVLEKREFACGYANPQFSNSFPEPAFVPLVPADPNPLPPMRG
jgi:hypothetical protein